MGMYLARFSYSRDALQALIKNPVDRTDAVTAAVESVGGKLHGFWYSFGEFDGALIMEMPDDASAAGFAVTVASTGSLTKFETTPLMSPADGIEAFRKAAAASYSPPS
jgi:uncharacterized protein with GYD domain